MAVRSLFQSLVPLIVDLLFLAALEKMLFPDRALSVKELA